MRRFTILGVACLFALTAVPSTQQATVIKSAADYLGATTLKTLRLTAAGANFSVGQNFTPNEPWPKVAIRAYTAKINYDTGAMSQELVRTMGATMPPGGGAPFTGDQEQNFFVRGMEAWNLPAAGRGPATPAPAPAAAVERMLLLWATPHGFLKAAQANNATMKPAPGGTEVSLTLNGKYKITGIINAQNEVERVQTWIDQPLVGDMLIETVYSGYKGFGSIKFPTKIVQNQDGYPSLELNILTVAANSFNVDIQVPDNVLAARPLPVRVESQKVADGVYFLTGGSHHSLAIEMKDHSVLVDAPLNEERALAVIAKTKELIPNKPIQYLVTTHHHWDHAGGIRTAIDEGATIVTHEMNKAFFERIAKTPHTINPDRLARSQKPVKIQAVGDKGQLTDGTRTVELYTIAGNEHSADMLMVYLPKEKILAEADAFTPPADANGSIVVTSVPFAAVLYDNIQQRKLDVQTIMPFHGGRTTDVAELARNAKKTATNSR
jgi:glyoxylase-like metal-dependent hydrolase (beta-lactamase superfamily II)